MDRSGLSEVGGLWVLLLLLLLPRTRSCTTDDDEMDRTARGTTTGWCDDGKQRSSGGIGGFRGNGTNAAVREHLDASLASIDIAATVSANVPNCDCVLGWERFFEW
jgi:hypothetical protein